MSQKSASKILGLALIGILAACVAGCPPAGPGPAGPREQVDAGPSAAELAVYAALSDYETSGDFVQINRDLMTTAHALGPGGINIWVMTSVADQYRDIDPDDPADTSPEFPVGTVIIKEHFSEAGADNGYLVMAKFEEGYAPESNDWWWGRFVPARTLTIGGGCGAGLDGCSVSFCITCHRDSDLARTDWLRGVPLDNRL